MIIMALDLEMNQPSNTIIQVGYCVGNIRTGDLHETGGWFVHTSELIHPDITKLTGIKQSYVDTAKPLVEVYSELVKVHKRYNCFCNPATWGGGDSELLRKQLPVDTPWIFGRRWIDVKTIHIVNQISKGAKVQGGLARSMLKYSLAFDGRKHDAADDAYNTWRLLCHFCKESK